MSLRSSNACQQMQQTMWAGSGVRGVVPKTFFDFFGIAVFGVSSYFAMLSLKIWVAINIGSIAN
jgi:hypothetical protein